MADEYIRRDDFIQHLEKCKKGAAVTNGMLKNGRKLSKKLRK